VRTRNDGSSGARRPERHAIFSWSTWSWARPPARSRARGIHPLERDDLLTRDRLAGDDVLEPDDGAIRPARTSLNLLALVACICSRRPMRSFLPRTECNRIARAQHHRIHADEGELTDERVGHDLERERANGSSSPGLRKSGSPFSFAPFTGGMSTATAVIDHGSSIACTPLFLNAEPHSIGTISLLMVRMRMPFFISSTDSSFRLEGICHQLLVGLGAASTILSPTASPRRRARRNRPLLELHSLEASSQ